MIIWKLFGLFFILRIIMVLPKRINFMKNIRAIKYYKNMLFSDNEKVINGIYVDISERYLDYLLEITRWIMGIILIWLLFFNQKTDIAINRNNDLYLPYLVIASLLSIYLAGGFIGDGIAKPFWNKIVPHRYYALSQKGVLYAGKIFPWQLFTSYSVDEKHQTIFLWSVTDPKLVLFYFTPDSHDKMGNIIEIVNNYLPINPRMGISTSKGSKINFLLPILISILSLTISVVVARKPIELTPLCISSIIVLHFYISYLIYKGMVPVEKMEPAEIQ